MGFALITESGTFNPGAYGLKAGDIIHVKCVGGGGGGNISYSSNTTWSAGNGGSTSFGDILTAPGGLGGTGQNFVSVVSGSCPGIPSMQIRIHGATFECAGSGGHGWHPKYGTLAAVLPAPLYMPMMQKYSSTDSAWVPPQFETGKIGPFIYGTMEFSIGNTDTNSGGTADANALPWGHAGNSITTTNTDIYSASVGGAGYGAGGGAGIYGSSTTYYGYGTGGSGGVIKDIDYVLKNTEKITITIGKGGAGTSKSMAGGGGANGCVAIWW